MRPKLIAVKIKRENLSISRPVRY